MVAKLLLLLFNGTGIRRVIDDAVKKPSLCRESGVEALVFNIMKGHSSRFHSKAERVLQLLTSEAIYPIGDKADQGNLVLQLKELYFDSSDFTNHLCNCCSIKLLGYIISVTYYDHQYMIDLFVNRRIYIFHWLNPPANQTRI